MPNYEFSCQACGELFTLFLTYAEYDRSAGRCPKCGSADLRQKPHWVRTAMSDKQHLSRLAEDVRGSDDPKDLGRVMRTIQEQNGTSLHPESEDALKRLEGK